MKVTAREKLKKGKASYVAKLKPEQVVRLGVQTMLIPSPQQLNDAIACIPVGKTKSMTQIREEMAEQVGAGVTCPLVAGIQWRVVAEAAEEARAAGEPHVNPWWRVTKDGKPNPKLPGGAERHRYLLLSEGVAI